MQESTVGGTLGKIRHGWQSKAKDFKPDHDNPPLCRPCVRHQQLTLPLDRWSLVPAAEANEDEDSNGARAASRDLRLFCSKRRGRLVAAEGVSIPCHPKVVETRLADFCATSISHTIVPFMLTFKSNLGQGQETYVRAFGVGPWL